MSLLAYHTACSPSQSSDGERINLWEVKVLGCSLHLEALPMRHPCNCIWGFGVRQKLDYKLLLLEHKHVRLTLEPNSRAQQYIIATSAFLLITSPVHFLDEFIAECFPFSPFRGKIQCRDSPMFVKVSRYIFLLHPGHLKSERDSSLLFHTSSRNAIPLEHFWHCITTISFDLAAGLHSAMSMSWYNFARRRLVSFFSS